MPDDKVEGKEKICGNCKLDLICVKITKEWNNKTETKLQWQTKATGKAHFKYAGPGKYNCILPGETETPAETEAPKPAPEAKPEPKKETVPGSIKVKDPFHEAEIITRWASEKAYKIVYENIPNFNDLSPQEKSGLGQKEGMLTRLLADTTIELMKLHNIKSNYGADAFD